MRSISIVGFTVTIILWVSSTWGAKKGGTPFALPDIVAFSEGLGTVKIGDKWGYMNNQGWMVIKPQTHPGRSIRQAPQVHPS
jgi:hypothetical protein